MGDVWYDVIKYELAKMPPVPFSPKPPVKTRRQQIYEDSWPCSNTGQKASEVSIIDYLTLVISRFHLEDEDLLDPVQLVEQIFGFGNNVVVGKVKDKTWNFYPLSAQLTDRNGDLVGHIGLGGNRDTYCISLSGAGCKWVKDWLRVVIECRVLFAKVTRID